MEKLVSYCDVIIGNEEDAEKVFGIKPENFNVEEGVIENARFESVARQLMEKFPKAKKIVITLRGSVNADHNTWSSVLFDGTKLHSSKTYDITDIVDRVVAVTLSAEGSSMDCWHITMTRKPWISQRLLHASSIRYQAIITG